MLGYVIDDVYDIAVWSGLLFALLYGISMYVGDS